MMYFLLCMSTISQMMNKWNFVFVAIIISSGKSECQSV